LHAEDFTVLDEGQPTKVLKFRAHNKADVPASAVDPSTEIILVLDEVNAPYARVAYAREGIETFLRQNGGNLDHPVSLAFFAESGLTVQTQPSIDGNAIAAALQQQGQSFRLLENGTGFYGAEQRLKLSMDAVNSLIAQERGKTVRKMVIWLSPGWPLLSGLEENLTEKDMQGLFGTVVGLSTALQRARMTLYSIDSLGADGAGTARTTFYQNFTKPIARPSDAHHADLSLQVLATQTGGQVIFGNNALANSLDRCQEDLDAYYTLSIAAEAAEKPDQFHGIEVKVASPGLKVRTRDGYYAQP
jgi:VWFA-related protein